MQKRGVVHNDNALLLISVCTMVMISTKQVTSKKSQVIPWQVKTLTGSLDKSLRSLEKARNQYAK